MMEDQEGMRDCPEQRATFLKELEHLQGIIAIIEETTRKIRRSDASTFDKEWITTTNKKATQGKEILQQMKESKSKKRDEKLREGNYNNYANKFVQVMRNYQNAQTEYLAKQKKLKDRQLKILNPAITQQELNSVEDVPTVYKNAILHGNQAADFVQSTHQNVNDKFQDVLSLEASVAELNGMFTDLATLVVHQGDMLDTIELNVKNTAEYIDQGNDELVDAIRLQQEIRRKQCCCLLVVILSLGVLAGVIAAAIMLH